MYLAAGLGGALQEGVHGGGRCFAGGSNSVDMVIR